MKSKNQVLNQLNDWAKQNNYTMKVLTSSTNNRHHMLKVEIAFIEERLHRTSFIIEITRFDDGKWSITSFVQMFETVHCRFNYIQEIIKREVTK